ncbi:MAG: hypothetical protein EXR49_03435 [Dehalococcoidia bacterium]|nr:hypothetical protein [Dehalococcoidia bacterium]
MFEKENSGVGAFRFEAQFAKQYDGKPNPIANYDVIKALGYYGVDRETIVKTFLQGRGVASVDYPSQPLDYGYIKQSLPAYDPVKAKDMLAKAGYPNGFDLDFIIYPRSNLPEGTEIMEAVVVGWEKLGIKINRQPMDFVSFQNKIFGRAFGDNGAFNKPTVSGMWYLGASPTAGATAASSHTVGGFNVNYDADITDAGKKWQAAITLDDYKKWRTEYMKLAIDKGAPTGGGMAIFTVGLLYAGSAKVPAKWDIGSGQDARNYQKAAGWRY